LAADHHVAKVGKACGPALATGSTSHKVLYACRRQVLQQLSAPTQQLCDGCQNTICNRHNPGGKGNR
jgi:hypothetical protein